MIRETRSRYLLFITSAMISLIGGVVVSFQTLGTVLATVFFSILFPFAVFIVGLITGLVTIYLLNSFDKINMTKEDRIENNMFGILLFLCLPFAITVSLLGNFLYSTNLSTAVQYCENLGDKVQNFEKIHNRFPIDISELPSKLEPPLLIINAYVSEEYYEPTTPKCRVVQEIGFGFYEYELIDEIWYYNDTYGGDELDSPPKINMDKGLLPFLLLYVFL